MTANGDTVEVEDEPVEYSIDELAAHTGVPSRTIRFYQSKKALHKPEIRGRKAVYTDDHVERLELIARLQERGLRIRAIRDLVARIDAGELVLDEWLGLEERLRAPWADSAPKLLSREELLDVLGGRKTLINDLVRFGFVEKKGTSYLVPSPGLLRALLDLEAAGVDLEVAKVTVDITRKHMAWLATALDKHHRKSVGGGFGRTPSPADLGAAVDGVRVAGTELVRILFGQEMERTLREFADSGDAARVTGK